MQRQNLLPHERDECILAREDIIRELLNERDDVVELQVQYTNGEVEDYNLLQSSAESVLDDIEWERVKEIELEYATGEEREVDFEELEDSDDDDDDDDDDEDNEVVLAQDEDEDDDDDDDEDDDDV